MNTILTITGLLLGIYSYPKNDSVTLTGKYSSSINNAFTGLVFVEKDVMRNFKGISSLKLKKFIIKKTSINRKQQLYSDYLQSQIDITKLKGSFKFNKWNINDTLQLYKGRLKNSIYVLSGITNNNHRIIITDSNNDGDFSNDKKFVFKDKLAVKTGPTVSENTIPFIDVSYQLYCNNRLIDTFIHVKAVPYKKYYSEYETKLEDKLEVAIQSTFYLEAYITLNDKPYTVYLKSDLIFDNKYYSNNSVLAIKENLNTAQTLSWHHLNEDILLKDKAFVRFNHVEPDGSSLVYDSFISNHSIGLNVGQIFPSHKFYDYNSNNSYQITADKSNYTLIDFWGSWCTPCIKDMPRLKKVYYEYSKNKGVKFISIAYDEISKVNKIRSILKQNSIPWMNYLDNKDLMAKSFEKTFHVYNYPTIIIIDKAGKVIFKSLNSPNAYSELSFFLNSL